ncbi:hypothetical protein D3C80_429700 [compost metagenome]
MQVSKRFLKSLAGAGVATAVLSQQAYAEGLADMAAGIDKTDILAGLTAVGLILCAIAAGIMGIRKVKGLIK